MRIGLDPKRWDAPPRQRTWVDWYFGCLMWFIGAGLLCFLLWAAWEIWIS